MKPLVLARRSSQLFFLLVFIYTLWTTTYPLAGPIPPGLLFKADPLLMAVTSVSQRLVLPGIAVSLCMIALSLVVGRFFCGWVCPLGSVIDAAGSLRKRARAQSDGANAALRKIKYYILGVTGALALLGVQVAWILDPIVIAGRLVSLCLIPTATLAANALFIFLIKDAGLGGGVKDLYHSLKETLLGVKVCYVDHAALIALFFVVVVAAAVALERFWCRALCPLGALYALAAKVAPLRRSVETCVHCGRCRSHCRMGAITDDAGYVRGECVLCMDCVYDCRAHITTFGFRRRTSVVSRQPSAGPQMGQDRGQTISRKHFLFLLLGSLPLFAARRGGCAAAEDPPVIRPPAALQEADFIDRCVRCGNCMKVCPTNALHPATLEAGIEGVWTPRVVPEIGYCEYHCTLCGRTCPTGAIPAITETQKHVVKIGTAEVDRSICLPWARGEECLVCEEHCPVPEKAIKLDSYAGAPARPYVDGYLCVGCGICQNKCPVRPARAIRVRPPKSQ